MLKENFFHQKIELLFLFRIVCNLISRHVYKWNDAPKKTEVPFKELLNILWDGETWYLWYLFDNCSINSFWKKSFLISW